MKLRIFDIKIMSNYFFKNKSKQNNADFLSSFKARIALIVFSLTEMPESDQITEIWLKMTQKTSSIYTGFFQLLAIC